MVLGNKTNGFTLAELLVALLILGEIATFTIPKILVSQQNGRSRAAAKEIAAAVSAAYQNYKLNLGTAVPASTSMEVLKPYINYIAVDTTSQLQDHPGASNVIWNCGDGNTTCLKMAAGGTLFWFQGQTFGGTGNNGMTFYYDPDGVNNGAIVASNPGVSVCFVLYYNGRVTDRNGVSAGTSNSYWPLGTGSGFNPDWFSW